MVCFKFRGLRWLEQMPEFIRFWWRTRRQLVKLSYSYRSYNLVENPAKLIHVTSISPIVRIWLMGTSLQDSFYMWGWICGSSFLCLSCCVVKENFEISALSSQLGWSREWYFTLVCIFSSGVKQLMFSSCQNAYAIFFTM
jgi:hypothetical protein